MKYLSIAFFMLCFISCSSPIEDLNAEVIAIHDEVMKQTTGTIPKLTKALSTAAGDTLLAEAQRVKINQNKAALDEAYEAMMTWMVEYKEPGKNASDEVLMNWLEQEKTKILNVKELTDSSIENARKTLNEIQKK